LIEKMRVHSGDSHVLEPNELFTSRLPADLGARAPRTERDERVETIFVDNKVQRRSRNDYLDSFRPPGAYDLAARLDDLDEEGVWGQLVFPSLGLWICLIEDPVLSTRCSQIYNDWLKEEYLDRSPRIVGAAVMPMASVDECVAELERVAALGYKAVFMPTTVADDANYGLELWDPFWHAASDAGVLVAFHIGTGVGNSNYRGRGRMIVNYCETTYPGMRVVTQLVASGVLDTHPELNVMIAEGGASWVPALAQRMNESYRQHGPLVEPKLSMLPSELIYRQVYSSFQHETTAVAAVEAMGYRNVMWGDDYPHLEGTYGHTQKALHDTFDGVAPDTVASITRGTFESLFEVPAIPDEISQ
jgi:predicted TIM-barrel fold metal-dependent hydrolase